MTIPILSQKSIHRVGRAVAWVEQQGVLTSGDPEIPNRFTTPGPVRCILLQNIFGGGSGVAVLVGRTFATHCFRVDVAGVNPVPDSSFKLELSIPSGDSTISLFISDPIPSTSTAEELQEILVTSANNAGISLTRSGVVVSLGNPMSIPDPVLLETEQPELTTDEETEDTVSYVGSWIIEFTDQFLAVYPTLGLSVVQDPDAFMKGLSTAITRPIKDVPSATYIVVHDVLNVPSDHPWKVGTLCIATYFIGLGHGIIASDYRDLTSTPYAEEDE